MQKVNSSKTRPITFNIIKKRKKKTKDELTPVYLYVDC